MSDIPYTALQPLLTEISPVLLPIDDQQRLMLNNINNFFIQDGYIRDRFFSWNQYFYDNLVFEIGRKITIPFNERRSTGIAFSKNIFENFCGYTRTNRFPLSADFSQTKIEMSPEYYRINVKTGAALHFQADVTTYPNTTVPISAIFYTDVVTDDYKFSLDKSNASINLINTSNTAPALKITQTGTADAFVIFDELNDTSPFVVDQAGKTGIGTPTPTATLDVRGIAGTNALTVNNNNTDSDFQLGSTNTDFLLFGDASTSRIGVNTDTPAGTLDVRCTAGVSALVVNSNNTDSDFQFGSTTTDYFLFGDASTSRIGVNTGVPAGTLDIRCIAGVSALVVNSNNTDSDFQFGSTTTDYFLFGDAGTNKIGIDTGVPAGTLDIRCVAGVSALVVNSNNTNSDFQFGSTTSDYLLFGDASENEIGINTAAPRGTLEIFATAGVSSLVVNANKTDSDFQFGSTTSDYLLFGDASTSRIGINTPAPKGSLEIITTANVSALVVNPNNTDSDFQFGSTTSDYLLFGDANNSRIGINTPTPTGTLDILGTTNVLALAVNTNNADSNFRFGSTSNDNLLFGDAGTSRIGINTANLNATLTVQGDISASSRCTHQTYTNTGVVASTTTSNTLTINAETTTRATWIVDFCNITSETLQISNLTNGREVFVYIRNTGVCNFSETANVAIEASTTTSGFNNVLCSNNGGTAISNISLANSSGAATVWVANIGGNIVGAIY